jgi:hypothetical protein
MVEQLHGAGWPAKRRRQRGSRSQIRGRSTPRSSPSRTVPYRSRTTLLSQGEAAFFGPLCRAVAGRFHVMCKVRLADVVTCSQANWKRGLGGAISQKHLDFVLCEKGTMRFVLAIELDDRSHAWPERQKRDRFVNAVLYRARVGLLRFQAQAQYSDETIRRRIDGLLRARNYAMPQVTVE